MLIFSTGGRGELVQVKYYNLSLLVHQVTCDFISGNTKVTGNIKADTCRNGTSQTNKCQSKDI